MDFSPSKAPVNPHADMEESSNTYREPKMKYLEIKKSISDLCQMEPEVNCLAEIAAKIESLQAVLDSLKSDYQKLNHSYVEVNRENDSLVMELSDALKMVEIRNEEAAMLESLLKNEKEKQIDLKGKKVVDIGDTSEEVKHKAMTRSADMVIDEMLNPPIQAGIGLPVNTAKQYQPQPENKLVAAKEAKNTTSQAELDCQKLECDYRNLQIQNETLMIQLSDAQATTEKIQKSSGYVQEEYAKLKSLLERKKEKEKQIDKKGMKMVQISDTRDEEKGRSDSCDQSKQKEKAQLKELLKMSRLEGAGSSSQTDSGSNNDQEQKLRGFSGKSGGNWKNETELISSLMGSQERVMEAVCALYRQEWRTRTWMSHAWRLFALSNSDYRMYVAFFNYLLPLPISLLIILQVYLLRRFRAFCAVSCTIF